MSKVVGDAVLDSLEWNHIAITNEANSQKIYVNGIEVISGSLTQYIAAETTASTRIGFLKDSQTNAITYYDGGIYDVQYYNRVLSSGDIDSIYSNGFPLTDITLRTSNYALVYSSVNYTQTVFDSSFSKITTNPVATRYQGINGISYDGSAIEVPYDASYNEDSFSVSMWVDPSSTASYQPLVNSLTSVASGSWTTEPTQRLRASDALGYDYFGQSVAISGNYAIVGAYGEDGPNDSLTFAGAAYIFDITNASGDMKPIARLRASDARANDFFGESVGIDGDYAIVGAKNEDGPNDSLFSSGAAYIFDITNASGEMKPIARLRASNAGNDDYFGFSVAISGNSAIVGAYKEDGPSNNASNAGAAYIFDITNASGDMNSIATLRASDAGDGDRFGYSVAISGTRQLLARAEDGPSNSLTDSGAAYIFDITNASGEMKPIARLRPSDREAGDRFGKSVAIDGNYAIVGAYYEDGPSNSLTWSGAAYIFDITNASGEMKPIARLRPSDARGGDWFGWSVAISGTNAIVGAYSDAPANSPNDSGGAYIFDITNASGEMKPIARLRASDAGSNDEFGRSVAISGTNAIVAARQEDGASNNLTNSGAAYIFNFQTSYQEKGYAIGISNEKVEFRLATDASQGTFEDLSSVITDAAIDTTKFTHIALTNTSNSQKIYVNGTEVKTGALSAYIPSTTASLLIGKHSNTHYDGGIFDVQYYNKVLSSTDVSSIYNNTEPVSGIILRTSNHTLHDTSVNYIQRVYDNSFSKIINTVAMQFDVSTNSVNATVPAYYRETYNYTSDTYEDVYGTFVRDICINNYLTISGDNPHYVQVGNRYTDSSMSSFAAGLDISFSPYFDPQSTFDICQNYVETYSFVGTSNQPDLSGAVTRDISVNEWIISLNAGFNPHYVQVGTKYTDASNSFNTVELPDNTYFQRDVSFNPPLNLDVSNHYVETYFVESDRYPDVHRGLTRDISVDNFFIIDGIYPYNIQRGNSYTGTESFIIQRMNDISNATFTSSTEISPPLNVDICGQYMQSYTISNDIYPDLSATLVREISVNDWITGISGDNPHYLQVNKSYTERLFHAHEFEGYSYTHDTSFQTFEVGQVNVQDVCKNYVQNYNISHEFYPDIYLDLSRVVSVSNWIGDISGENPHYLQVGKPYTDTLFHKHNFAGYSYTHDTSFTPFDDDQCTCKTFVAITSNITQFRMSTM